MLDFCLVYRSSLQKVIENRSSNEDSNCADYSAELKRWRAWLNSALTVISRLFSFNFNGINLFIAYNRHDVNCL
jgi:hypothetical protein